MTDTTNPGDIQVWGQRIKPDGTFPSATGPGGGTGGDPGGPGGPQSEQDGEQPNPTEVYTGPCADPDQAKIWNADAAAIASVPKMLAKAASLGDGSNFSNREFGAHLLLSANNAVDSSDVEPGDAAVGGSNP